MCTVEKKSSGRLLKKNRGVFHLTALCKDCIALIVDEYKYQMTTH